MTVPTALHKGFCPSEYTGASVWPTLPGVLIHVDVDGVTVSCGTVCFIFHVILQLDHNNYPKWDNGAYFTFGIFRLELR